MPPSKLPLILILTLLITPTKPDPSFISLLITRPGLTFIKDLLITKAISQITPTRIPQIEKVIKIPLIGNVYVLFSNISIYRVNVGSSEVRPGSGGVWFDGSGVNCGLSLSWEYSYGSWIGPVSVSDSGSASVEVNGMEIGVMLNLTNQEGYMNLSVIECNCHIQDISIDLDGGESWLYQGVLDAFKEEIESAVEKAITKKLKTSVSLLDSILQTLPKQVVVDNVASLNVTFVDNPTFSNTSVGFEINGLFTENRTETRSYNKYNHLQPSIHCSNPSKMVGIALDEAVFESACALYYDASFMQWVVDKVPEQSLLNTAGWRFIVPQLYRKYPNHDMNLNISLSDPPAVKISSQNIAATVYVDLIINVLEGDETIPVACIALVIAGTGSVHIDGNNLASHMNMDDFTMSLKWSKIGTLHMFLIQPVMWTMIETVFLPYVNTRLGTGFPLPIIKGFMLQNAEIITSDSRITVCSDVSYDESFNTTQRVYTS